MQTVEISRDIALAMNTLENLINGEDGDFIFEAVKKYKKYKALNNRELGRLKVNLMD